jgi:hypothetical protein
VQTPKCTPAGLHIPSDPPPELLNKVVDQSVVEVLTTQVGITGSGLNLEDTTIDGQQRNIESSTAQIEVVSTGTTSQQLQP